MEFPEPERQEYVDVVAPGGGRRHGGTSPSSCTQPAGAGAHPAEVIGAEGAGINHFVGALPQRWPMSGS